MSDLHEEKTNQVTTRERIALPAIFINKEGDPEHERVPVCSIIFGASTPPFTSRQDAGASPGPMRMTEASASNRLRRVLLETGQLYVTTKDGMSRVCFAGMGDPDRLFVESVSRDVPLPSLDGDFNGCVCSLSQAEEILRRMYRGENSDKLAATLNRLAPKLRVSADRRLRVA